MDELGSNRQSPDEILEGIKKLEQKKIQGKLKIFFGMCAGVGKTYAMLQYAKELIGNSKDVVIGYIETHGRTDTEKLLAGLTVLPRKKIEYKGLFFEEFDLEQTLALKPQFVLVDELAHTNVPGSKHSKRYQDVIELLENGINVLTTLNVQHIESRSKTVEQITGIPIHETVPDSIIELTENIELVDLPIEELLQRLSDGKVYIPEKAKAAFQNFFKAGNLISLREIALRLTAEKVESDLVNYMSQKNIEGPWKAGDKLMVAVGASPFSAELIRWTRRMAYALKSQWYAVYVKTNIKENDKTIEQLEKNLRLAKELGAEVVVSADTDLVNGLISIAKKNNVAQIIIGKPARYNVWNYLRRNNYVDRLIQQSGDIDIYIVRPGQVRGSSVKKQKLFALSSPTKDYFLTSAAVLLVAVICFPFRDYIGYQSVGLIMLFNLLLMPFYSGRGAIFFSALLNSLIWNFFFIPPVFTFEIGKLHDFLTLLLNIVIAVTSGVLATRIRKQQRLVRSREKNALALLKYTKELSECSGKQESVVTTLNHLEVNFKLNAFFFDKEFDVITSSNNGFAPSEKETAIARWCLEHGAVAGKFTSNLPDSEWQFFPVTTRKSKVGVLCLQSVSKLSIEDENLINNILTQFASVYEKEESEETIKNLMFEAESKKLYDTLLDSISHEFRTPIAVISGSSTGLLEDNITNNPELVKNLAGEIYIASKRLNLLVENLLDITRLESGKIKLNKQPYNIAEVVNDVCSQLKDSAKKHNLKIVTSDDSLIAEFDYGFISQAIFNILHNAFSYTPEGTDITIELAKAGNNLLVKIADNGPGLSKESMQRLFEKFYRPPGTKTGGTGLGLSIAKGFIEAHGGQIAVRKNEPDGLIFDIVLPL